MTIEQPPPPVHATAEETPPAPTPPFRRDDFNAFYTQEMSAVTVFLMHQGATAYEAADAAHEAVAKLLPDLWRTLDHPRAWLRITAQRCYWRQTTTRAAPTDPVPDRPGGTCPLAAVVVSEFQQTVLDALRRLPPTMRTVMAWDIDGFTYTEIAEALAMNPAAVRQNISRARRRLITALDL
ncbi:RNA polymerase sigma factor [Streptomyces murinus]|uniref:RNA polymerase sigma-70 factor (ECF subfamily) n=1 Tax=Streptomyces murinus TaxID=33900 RepID=A0A7W3RIH3_STRMR|nr:sigma-70 family RNA polymerase sigma factor [Streptomyces murinus]MBA9050997.1 RNA polymerase sigma-70 factor (ECF subfamily) [Streptomyces murinus]